MLHFRGGSWFPTLSRSPAEVGRPPSRRSPRGFDRHSSPLSSGKYDKILLRTDRNGRWPSALRKPFGRSRGGDNPSSERRSAVTRPRTARPRPEARAREIGPRLSRSTRTLRGTAFPRCEQSVWPIGTNDEGCRQLSFIVGADRTEQPTGSERRRVNRRVSGVGQNDLRGEGQG